MTYTITGPLTVEEVDDHARSLRKAFAETEDRSFRINIQGLTEFDLLGLQLLYAVQKECQTAGRGLEVSGKESLRRLGNMIAFCGLPPLEVKEVS